MSYYSILGLPFNSSSTQIREAYKAAALKYHPDKSSSDDNTSHFQQINEAYQTLRDKDKRARYDKSIGIDTNVLKTTYFDQKPRKKIDIQIDNMWNQWGKNMVILSVNTLCDKWLQNINSPQYK